MEELLRLLVLLLLGELDAYLLSRAGTLMLLSLFLYPFLNLLHHILLLLEDHMVVQLVSSREHKLL